MENQPLLKSSQYDYNSLRAELSGAENETHTGPAVGSTKRQKTVCDQGSSDIQGTSYSDPESVSKDDGSDAKKSHPENRGHISEHKESDARRSPPGSTMSSCQQGRHTVRRGSSDHETDPLDADSREAAPPSDVAETETLKVKDVKQRLFFLTLVCFSYSCGNSLYIPVLTQYTYQVFTQQVYGNQNHGVHVTTQPCVNTTSSNSSSDDVKEQEVQGLSGDLLAHLNLVNSGLAIVSNVFLGSYSDVLGRKLVLVLPVLGYSVKAGLLSAVIQWELSLSLLYAGYVVDGLCGSFLGVLVGQYAYAADLTRAGGERTLGLTLMDMAIGFGQCLVDLLAGLFLQTTGFFYPALVAAGLMLMSLILIILLLPETVKRDRTRVTSPLKMPCRLWRTFLPPGTVYRRALLLLGLLSQFLYTLPYISLSPIQSLYLMDRPFCWGSLRQGILSTANDTSSYVVTLLLVKLLQDRVAAPVLTIIGVLSEVGRHVVMGLANSDRVLYIVVGVGACRRLVFPSLRAFLSSLVPKDRQGAVFSGIGVVESACASLSQTIFMPLYKGTLGTMAGVVFFVFAGVDLIVVLLCLVMLSVWGKFQRSQSATISVQAKQDSGEDRK